MGRRKRGPTQPPDWEALDISKFKLVEKRYKRYSGRQTDFSGALHPDMEGPARSRFKSVSSSVSALEIEGRDGLILLPGFLSPEEQVTKKARM